MGTAFYDTSNRKKQYIGSTDEPLDEEMIPQDLKNYPQIDALTVSPMLRCRQTAKRIWPSMPFETEPLMRELDFGEYERKTYEELKNKPAYQAWLDSRWCRCIPWRRRPGRFSEALRTGSREYDQQTDCGRL